MNRPIVQKPAANQGGFMLIAVMAIVTALLATSIAFLRWPSDEQTQTNETIAAMQAYYLAQQGIVEKGFAWLRSLPASQLPIHETVLEGERVPGIGKYETVAINALFGESGGNFWAQERRFRISTVGVVRMPFYDSGGNNREHYKDVRRKAVLYVEVRNFADYMYLSDNEMTWFGDRIKFWHGDTLNGRVHSNSQIAVMQDPVFYEQVTSTAEDFWRGTGYAPVFPTRKYPIFNANRVDIPVVAQNLRDGAAAQGHFYAGYGKTYRARFANSEIKMFRWDTGTPVDSTDNWIVPISDRTCIFVDAPLEIHGLCGGRVTIGSSQNVRLLDDIRYTHSRPFDGYLAPNEFDNEILGIVSEGDVKVANTVANGRENSNGLGNNQSNRAYTSIVITAAIVALGTSFTFENQNDPDSGYVSSTIPDDRGTIYLYGSVTQMRRGYVHRSTNSSTGYLKQYKYDTRLLRIRPACFFDVTDEEGKALFNIVQWGQNREAQDERADGILARYN
ncbi:MAG: hypothetical protein ACOZB3_08780 [Calditrichota bacterium]